MTETTFADLGLAPNILKALDESGYKTPTPIQAEAIPHVLSGGDVTGIAQTGTGKTAAFVLPMIHRLSKGRARARMPRCLILCPTRELAAQVAESFEKYGKHLKLTMALLIGGVSFKEQEQLIDKGVDVLIATPGRLLDHFERGKLILTDVKVMVVDEADRMLDMGFIPDIERIFSLTPFTRQTLFFSATMAPEIERITNTFLSNPERIEVARQATASETIEQGAVFFKGSRKDREGSEKRTVLRQLIDREGEKCTNAIVFCNRKVDVDIVAKSLKKYGYNAEPIHGDLDQSQRTRTLEGFREGSIRLLIASDVAARGLDVPSVSHVFNFDVPGHAEDYVHRIGRTGRAGREGKAFTIVVPRDEKNFEDVEKLLQKEIPRVELPGVKAPAKAEATADEEKTDAKPKRTRSRSRKSDKVNAPAEATAAEAPATEAPVEAPEESKDTKESKAPAQKSGADKPRSDRGRSDKGRGRGSKSDNNVVGMGDHLPEFIALSFDERRAS